MLASFGRSCSKLGRGKLMKGESDVALDKGRSIIGPSLYPFVRSLDRSWEMGAVFRGLASSLRSNIYCQAVPFADSQEFKTRHPYSSSITHPSRYHRQYHPRASFWCFETMQSCYPIHFCKLVNENSSLTSLSEPVSNVHIYAMHWPEIQISHGISMRSRCASDTTK